MFRAYEPEQDRLVAVKLFRLDLPPDRLHRLVAEFEQLIAADLTHPAIATPIAAGVAGVTAYLAQDFVAADSLDIILRDRRTSPPCEVLRVITQVAGALDVAAAGRIVHGALHPRDLLVSLDDVRVTGLGIARALERVGVTAPVRRPHTAPERVGGRAWDRRADVFSLGVLAHEMLWGRRPSATGARAADELTDVPGADLTALRGVFSRALAETFTDRFDSAERFVDALRAALGSAAEAGDADPAIPDSRDRPPLEPVEHVEREEGARGLVDLDQFRDADLNEPFLPEPVVRRGATGARPVEVSAAEAAPGEAQVLKLPVDAPALTAPVEPEMVSAATNEAAAADVPAPRPPKKVVRRDRLVLPDARGVRAESSLFFDASPEPAAAAVMSGGSVATVVPAAPGEASTADLPFASYDDRARSAVWPLVMAIGVGLAVGFAGGYGLGGRQRAQSPAPVATPSTSPASISPTPASAESPRSATENPSAPAPAPLPLESPPPAVPAAVASPPARAARPREVPERSPRPSVPARPPPARAAPVPLTAMPATLVVESRPAGANVFLDGRLIGITPLSLSSLATGDHAVRIELAGYNQWTSSVRLAGGEHRRVAASLER